ncbi:MAG: acyl-CoA dehydrogenase family protein [Acidobacteriota bacterium]|nr:acyl-CoA dehydrogenase family protein [Acidobacteriota bacterium]
MSEIQFGREQAMLADIATRFFRDKHAIEAVREQLLADDGYDAGVWSEMVEAGWLDLVIPEAHGGAGFGMTELVTIVEPMGRRLFGSPFLATQLAIQALIHSGASGAALREQWLPALATGTVATVATVEADGDWNLGICNSTVTLKGSTAAVTADKRFVLDLPKAELVVLSLMCGGEAAVAFLPGGALETEAVDREVVVDETRRSYRLKVYGVEIESAQVLTGEDAAQALLALRNAGLLLVSAEACGGIAGALDLVVDYLNSRRQFDRLIGSYQALKHPTVDILIGLERSRSHLYHAATVYDSDAAESALRMLKVEASESFAFAGDRAVQFHGGFGFTYECDAQLYLRRALWCQYQFGDALHHRKHLAELIL